MILASALAVNLPNRNESWLNNPDLGSGILSNDEERFSMFFFQYRNIYHIFTGFIQLRNLR